MVSKEKEITTSESNTGTSGGGNSFSKFFKILGPGLITAALMIGPGSVTLNAKLGAMYGSQLVWSLIAAVLLMACYTEMAARIGIAGKDTFINLVKDKWGKAAGVFIGIGAFLVCSSFQAGNAIGTGIAIEAFTGVNASVWIVVATLLGVALLFSSQFYRVLEKLMLVLVVLMLVAFLITIILVQPSISDILSGFVPKFPEGSMGLVIGLIATSFSIVGALYQSYLVREKGVLRNEAKASIFESIFGIFLLGLISFLIMVTAASVLHPEGIMVNNAIEMADILRPSFGSFAVFVFVLGLFGASYSSLIGNATIGGGLLADGLGLGHQLSSLKVKISIIAVMVFGSSIALIFNGNPVNLITFAQGVTIFVVPFIAVAILFIANSKEIMGDLKNKLLSNTLGVIGLLLLIYLAFNNFKNIFLS